jgi:hypothetical protein
VDARDDETRALTALRALYAEADALYAGWSCPASSECCHFGVTGREPYVTSIEILAIERAIARRGGALAPKRRALPIAGDAERERICRMLDRDGRCSIYADRPLGCRTFYCERASAGVEPPRDALRGLVQRLRELAVRHTPDGDRARPLSRVLTGTKRE